MYYNCAVIYVIIAVSISFIIVKYLGHLKHANQVLHDCCYLNDSNLGAEPIHIENCTLNEFEDHDVKDVSCYDVGYHPVVGIAICLVVSLMLKFCCCLLLCLGFMSFRGRNIWLKWMKITVYIYAEVVMINLHIHLKLQR